MKLNKYGQKLALAAMITLLLIIAVFPVYWMFITSLKTNSEIYKVIPTFWPTKVTLAGYKKLLFETNFLNQVGNSLIVASVVSLISTVLSMFAAYAIAKLHFRGRNAMSQGIFYAYLMPRSILFIPLYLFATRIGVADSIWGLIIVYPTFTIPYATWMLTTYFQSIPVSLEEAATIDGCSRFGSMCRIVFPLSAPGIISTLIFSFTLCWSEYLYALVIISKDAQKTIPLGLSDMIVGDVYAWGPLMGGAILASIPIVILYMISNRYIISGATAGGEKG